MNMEHSLFGIFGGTSFSLGGDVFHATGQPTHFSLLRFPPVMRECRENAFLPYPNGSNPEAVRKTGSQRSARPPW